MFTITSTVIVPELLVEALFKSSLPQREIKLKTNLQAKKVQVGKDQEKAQSEKDSHSKNRGGKKPN